MSVRISLVCGLILLATLALIATGLPKAGPPAFFPDIPPQGMDSATDQLVEPPIEQKIKRQHTRPDAMHSQPRPDAKKLRVVVVGSHPEDPMFACGGLIAKLASDGHEVIVASVASKRRVAVVGFETYAETRRNEFEAATKLLGAKAYLFDYQNEFLFNDEPTRDAITTWLSETNPDVVVTHWPLDTNGNHHVTGALVWNSYLNQSKWNLYFFENVTYYQTLAFNPQLFLDIADVRDLKKEACLIHKSQNPKSFWTDQDDVQRQRGKDCGAQFAEAFILAEHHANRPLLPLGLLQKNTDERGR